MVELDEEFEAFSKWLTECPTDLPEALREKLSTWQKLNMETKK